MVMDPSFAFDRASLVLRPLGASDEPKIQALCERCADYLEETFGLPPTSFGARRIFEGLAAPAPGRYLFGVHSPHGQLIAVLDVLKDYAVPQEWCLVQLVIDPGFRRQGLGAQIYRSFESWAKTQGAQDILLAVSESNVRGFKFWRGIGFETIERGQLMTLGRKRQRMTVMAKFLVAGRKEFLMRMRRC